MNARIRSYLFGTLFAASLPVPAMAAPLLSSGAAPDVHTAGSPANGSIITFEGFHDGAPIGGPIGNASFGADWHACVDSDAGGYCNIANEPSPSTIAYPTGTASDILFATPVNGASFFYSLYSPVGVTTVTAYDINNNVLQTLTLDVCGTDICGAVCSGDPAGNFCLWTPAALTATGIKRISFGGSAPNGVFAVDNFQYDTVPAVPGPGPLALIALAFGLGFGTFRSRR